MHDYRLPFQNYSSFNWGKARAQASNHVKPYYALLQSLSLTKAGSKDSTWYPFSSTIKSKSDTTTSHGPWPGIGGGYIHTPPRSVRYCVRAPTRTASSNRLDSNTIQNVTFIIKKKPYIICLKQPLKYGFTVRVRVRTVQYSPGGTSHLADAVMEPQRSGRVAARVERRAAASAVHHAGGTTPPASVGHAMFSSTPPAPPEPTCCRAVRRHAVP